MQQVQAPRDSIRGEQSHAEQRLLLFAAILLAILVCPRTDAHLKHALLSSLDSSHTVMPTRAHGASGPSLSPAAHVPVEAMPASANCCSVRAPVSTCDQLSFPAAAASSSSPARRPAVRHGLRASFSCAQHTALDAHP